MQSPVDTNNWQTQLHRLADLVEHAYRPSHVEARGNASRTPFKQALLRFLGCVDASPPWKYPTPFIPPLTEQKKAQDFNQRTEEQRQLIDNTIFNEQRRLLELLPAGFWDDSKSETKSWHTPPGDDRNAKKLIERKIQQLALKCFPYLGGNTRTVTAATFVMKDALFSNNRSYVHHVALQEEGDPLSKKLGFLELAQLIDALQGLINSLDENQVQALLDESLERNTLQALLDESLLVKQVQYDRDTLQVVALSGDVSLTLSREEVQGMTIAELYVHVAQNSHPVNQQLSLVTRAGEKLDSHSGTLVTTALDIVA